MTDSVEIKPPQAWQPVTARGVAAFAKAPSHRLLVVQFLFALVAAITVVWVLKTTWFPTVRDAILALPEQGAISGGKLSWSTNSPQLLAEGHFLAFIVDTNHTGDVRSPAQIQIEFGRDDFRVICLGGYYSEFYYANAQPIPFNRIELEPWWGAWRPPILWMAFAGTIAVCFVSWTILAMIYFLPVWLVAFFINRDVSFRGAWKLSGAALMPGAGVMIGGILFYGFGALDLVKLAAVVVAHIITGWIYVGWAIAVAPKITEAQPATANPFASEAPAVEQPKDK